MVDITMVKQRFFRRRHPSQRLLGFRQWLLPQYCSAPTRRLLQSQSKTSQLMIARLDLIVNRTWKFTLSNQTICTNLRSFDRERRFSSCFARLLCVNRLRIERTTKFWLSKNRYQFKLLAHSQRGSFHGCFVTALVYCAAEATTIVTFVYERQLWIRSQSWYEFCRLPPRQRRNVASNSHRLACAHSRCYSTFN